MRQSNNNPFAKNKTPLFPITQTYPQFFSNNLIDDNRVIKILKGQMACLRAFYYQLFKLAFEIEIQPSSNESHHSRPTDYIGEIKTILNKCAQKHKILEFNVQKIKNFINFMTQNQRLSFEIQFQLDQSLDQAMITILQSFFDSQNIYENSVEEIFFYLSSIFKITLNQYENCLKFSQSDVFVYIESQTELYLAYLDVIDPDESKKGIKEIQRLSCSSEQEKQEQAVNQIQKSQLEGYIPREREKVRNQKNDTIMNIFGDMLYSSRNDGNSKIFGGDSMNHTNTVIPNSPPKEQFKTQSIPEQVKLQNKNQDHDNSQVNHYNVLQNEKRAENPKKTSKEEEVKAYQREQDIFYRPKTNMQTIPQSVSPRQSVLHSKYRKDPLDMDNSEEKGTFYRQFTNTRILKILPEPHRTKVKILKNRFIGLHSHLSKQ